MGSGLSGLTSNISRTAFFVTTFVPCAPFCSAEYLGALWFCAVDARDPFQVLHRNGILIDPKIVALGHDAHPCKA